MGGSRARALREKVASWIARLSARERLWLAIAGTATVLTIVYLVVDEVRQSQAELQRQIAVREAELSDIARVGRRFRTLRARLERLEDTFAESELSFAEVTSQLDAIVKESIGEGDYELKKGGSPQQIGFEYEKEDFTLRLNALTLEQVIRLLYRLEQGDSPLFLGKVDIVKTPRSSNFNATLEIFSVRKS